MTSSEPPEEAGEPKKALSSALPSRALLIAGLLLIWTFLYNRLIKDQGVVDAFFSILDTLSEDVVMDSLITIVVGLLILCVFTGTKLYTQIISDAYSFRILEEMFVEHISRGNWRELGRRLLNFQEEPQPASVLPQHPWFILIAFSLLYVMSWVYLVLFSEALFFVSWSAGVDLPITAENLELLPTLALAIPFSARVMAWLRYPYTQDYADFMPGAVFVLLLVLALGYLFRSDDQKFFLTQIWASPEYTRIFLRSGLLLAFTPVFAEAIYWLGVLFLEPSPPDR